MHQNSFCWHSFRYGKRKTDFVVDVNNCRFDALHRCDTKIGVIIPFLRLLELEVIIRPKVPQWIDTFDRVNMRLRKTVVGLVARPRRCDADMMKFITVLQFSLQARDQVLYPPPHAPGNREYTRPDHPHLFPTFTPPPTPTFY